MESLTRIKPILGTYVSIAVTAVASREELIKVTEAAYREIYRIHELMSFQEINSEITKINLHAFKHPLKISEDTYLVVKTALDMSKSTDGVFDISCGGAMVLQKKLPDHGFVIDKKSKWDDIQLDFGEIFFNKPLAIDVSGLAKGYAVDQAYKRMISMLSRQKEQIEICINAGGDLKQTPWQDKKIKIKELGNPGDSEAYVKMRDSSVATSSGAHSSFIIQNGKNICNKNRSVSVFAPSCMIADALTKVLYANPKALPEDKTYTSCVVVENGKSQWLE